MATAGKEQVLNRTTARGTLFFALAAISFGALGGCYVEGDIAEPAEPEVFVLGESNITLGANEEALFRGRVPAGAGAIDTVIAQLTDAGQVLSGPNAAGDDYGYVQVVDVTGPEAFDCLVLDDGEVSCTPLPAVAEDERLFIVTTLAPTDDETQPGYLPMADFADAGPMQPGQGRLLTEPVDSASYYGSFTTFPRFDPLVNRFRYGRVSGVENNCGHDRVRICPNTVPEQELRRLQAYYFTTIARQRAKDSKENSGAIERKKK